MLSTAKSFGFQANARSTRADSGCNSLSKFRAEHNGVSNPGLFHSFRGVRGGKATFVVGLHTFGNV